MIVWIDLEASGLRAAVHAVLEFAAIVTDDRLQETGRFHRVVHWEGAAACMHLGADSSEDAFAETAASTGIDLAVVKMHARNGLWGESARSPHLLGVVDDQLTTFLMQLAGSTDGERAQEVPPVRPPIAGSSIWLDRSFMAVSLPCSLEQLHYRSIDVTTLNELAKRFWPELHGGKPHRRELHRALPDIEDSLTLGRYYAAQVARMFSGSTS